MRKCEVWWIDTIGFQGWHSDKEIDELTIGYIIKSVGYLVKKTKLFLIIAQSFDYGNKKFGNVTCIPKKAIIRTHP